MCVNIRIAVIQLNKPVNTISIADFRNMHICMRLCMYQHKIKKFLISANFVIIIVFIIINNIFENCKN